MNTKKTAITIVVAMMAIAMLTVAINAQICQNPPCEKDCGTKVEQCDTETVYRLTPLLGIQVGYYDADFSGTFNGEEGMYVDMDPLTAGFGVVSDGDVRLSGFCGTYEPNTKVGPHDNDRGMPIAPILAVPFMFTDINGNGQLDIPEGVYVDSNGNAIVSPGDIRITDSPAAAVGVVSQGDYGLSWSRVVFGEGDVGMVLTAVPDTIPPTVAAGTAPGVVWFIDSDCSTTWTCPDKLYLQQAHGDWQHDTMVTIGDVRLYIPPDDAVFPPGMGECIPDCGTKVSQCSKDAVYAVVTSINNGGAAWTWGYYDTYNPGVFDAEEGAYLDMDLSGTVTAGDVRLSDFCGTYDANTKVGEHDNDLNHPLAVVGQVVFRYTDLNQDGVYDLLDPVYLDTDLNGVVDINDIRITDAPVCDGNWGVAASFGPAWSRVKAGEVETVGGFQVWLLTPLPAVVGVPGPAGTPWNALGYIDSDCSLSWTCPDKLYLQQAHGNGAHDRFVTIGDVRLYIPPEAQGPGPDEPCWLPCGTKVIQCDVDMTYALEAAGMGAAVWAFHDTGIAGVFDDEDAGYIDMNGDGFVTAGDVRVSNVCGRYPPNTKVGPHDDDLNEPLVTPVGAGQTVIRFWNINQNFVGIIPLFDMVDPVYIDTNVDGLVSKDDLRITACPPYDVQGILAGSIAANWTQVRVGDGDMGQVLNVIGTGIPAVELRYVDSDCSLDWTCPDKLYLNQLYPGFVTIGDVRFYMPNSSIGGACRLEGDVNDDGNIDGIDGLLIARHIVGLGAPLTGDDYLAADVNDDSSVDGIDGLLIARYIVGLITTFPGGVCIP